MTRPIMISMFDYSGIMAEPWAESGIECYCVDTQHRMCSEKVKGNIHFVYGDARSWTLRPGKCTGVKVLF